MQGSTWLNRFDLMKNSIRISSTKCYFELIRYVTVLFENDNQYRVIQVLEVNFVTRVTLGHLKWDTLPIDNKLDEILPHHVMCHLIITQNSCRVNEIILVTQYKKSYQVCRVYNLL